MKRTGLRPDPEKVRAWLRRSRERQVERGRERDRLRAAPLRSATPPSDFRDDDGNLIATPTVVDTPIAMARGGFRRPPKIPTGVRNAALARSEGLCVVCVHDMRRRGQLLAGACRATQLHHVFPKAKWPDLAKLVENLIGVCPGCHADHENAHRRIPLAALPESTIALAEAYGIGWYLERTYPA